MTHPDGKRSLTALSIAATGVVFGDIGTSPLYALRACFSGVAVTLPNVLGILSLIFWSLLLVISVKYVSIILRVDNNGEGGVLALTTRVLNERPLLASGVISTVGLMGCALFYGDGVITPAVTVLGAMEGLSIVAPSLEQAVLPLSIVALFALFALQRKGTGSIGRLFGPLMVVWFVALAVLGAHSVALSPAVLAAINPVYGFRFFAEHLGVGFAVYGVVFLTVTGGEALYSDLGHFGRRPIALAWFVLVWPCLLLNYFGQAALLLRNPEAIDNPFYLLAPDFLRVPLIVIATAASVIASQAVLSGVFAITQQCRQLGYIPRVKIRQTSASAIGQVYVPSVNWLICAATIALAIGFGSSSRITHAYGVGVSCTMLIDCVLILVLLSGDRGPIARLQTVVMSALLVIDAAFVIANLDKVPTGGWFPLLFGFGAFGAMKTWQRGRQIVTDKMRREERPLVRFLERLNREPPLRTAGLAVYMTSNTQGVPRTLSRSLATNRSLHEHTILLSVQTAGLPRIPDNRRVKVESLGHGLYRVVAQTGFMEFPDVPRLLKIAEPLLPFRVDLAVYFMGQDAIVIGNPRGMHPWRKRLFVFLAQNSQYAASTFSIPPSRLIKIAGQVEI
ncbi:MAG: KUP/HAK/KT family potassium transporter [Gammaproteobacteria bacterium]